MKAGIKTYAGFAWATLILNVLVILWGAVVRATGSGAGCGAHWPLCNGEIMPANQQLTTMIEFGHRISSGLALIAVLALIIWTWRKFERGSRLRWSAGLAGAFTLSEALVGAGLVLFHLTGTNDSVARAVVIVIHLVNTFVLLAALVVTAWWASVGEPEEFVWHGKASVLLVAAILGVVFLGGSGAITALGDTLFPAASLMEGFNQEFSPSAHFLLRLRVYHPLVAFGIAFVGWIFLRWFAPRETNPLTGRAISGLMVLFGLQLVVGGINVLLLAPVWMQVVHLLVTDLLWMAAVMVLMLHLGRGTRTVDLTVGVIQKEIHHPVT
jgi:heme A synthase